MHFSVPSSLRIQGPSACWQSREGCVLCDLSEQNTRVQLGKRGKCPASQPCRPKLLVSWLSVLLRWVADACAVGPGPILTLRPGWAG